MDIKILSETQIEVYHVPGQKVLEESIIYQAETMAPRSIWIDADQLPDMVFRQKNPGKPVPPDIQAQGDAVRRKAIEADMAKAKTAAGPRTI